MQQWRNTILPDPDHKAPALALYKDAPVGHDQFHNDVAALRSILQQRPESNWGLYCDESYAFAVSLIALLDSGKKPVVLPNLQPEFVRGIASHLDALLTDRAHELPAIATVQASVGVQPPVIAPPAVSLEKINGTVSIFTSGSTGEPKRIEKRWQQLKTEVEILERTWGDQLRDALIVSTVSHQHIYGMLFKVLWPLFSGRCFDSALYQYPEPLLERIAKLPAAVLISSPAHLKRIPKMIDLGRVGGRLLAIFSSGGPLPNDAACDIAQALKLGVTEVFGSTETGGVAYRSQTQAGEIAPWTPLPLVDIRTDGGCLMIRSPFEGSGDWHKMGDLVEMLDDGRFLTQGRADKIVKVEEKRLSLAEVETRLAASGLISEAVATVLESNRHSVAVAAILSAEGKVFLEQRGHKELCSQLREYLARYFEAVVLPKKWRFIGQMPVNSQGKITQSAVKRLFLDADHLEDGAFSANPVVESIERTDAGIVLNLSITPDIIYFNGHFPGRPVLPGVAQLAWAHALGKQYFNVPDDCRALEAVKFHRFIEPGDKVRLSLSYNPDKRKLTFSYESDKGVHSSGRLAMGA
ncbi:MAG TPA: AMP-binding protein [Gammaproteobacteria bacterium]|nr:AMP-binding protein [Gammaproteobacteria bacterium]